MTLLTNVEFSCCFAIKPSFMVICKATGPIVEILAINCTLFATPLVFSIMFGVLIFNFSEWCIEITVHFDLLSYQDICSVI